VQWIDPRRGGSGTLYALPGVAAQQSIGLGFNHGLTTFAYRFEASRLAVVEALPRS
jgi:hypothetical protein